MPNVTTANRYQDAVVWPLKAYDGNGGPILDVAVPCRVRWKWGYSEMLDAKGNTVVVDALVAVNLDVPVDSVIWKGSINDLTGTAGPNLQTVEGLCQVKGFKHTSDTRGRFKRRTVGVVRFRGPLPSVPGMG